MADMMDIYAAHAFWVWIVLAAGLLALEVATGSGWLLWPAASAFVVAFLAQFAGLSAPTALVVFAILTIASTLLARRIFPRSMTAQPNDINDNVSRLVGRQTQALSPFQARVGRVSIDGKEWAAELDDGEAADAGARLQIVGVVGSILHVRRA